MAKMYLAGGYGFKEINRIGIVPLINILSKNFDLILPFERAAHLGRQIADLEKELKSATPKISPAEIIKRIEQLNFAIGQGNENYILEADRIFAILDGSDQDAGTAAECGFGYAHGKLVDGYRGDFRPTGENSATKASLQLEYFIKKSGGQIFTSFREVKNFFQ